MSRSIYQQKITYTHTIELELACFMTGREKNENESSRVRRTQSERLVFFDQSHLECQSQEMISCMKRDDKRRRRLRLRLRRPDEF
jgi:hypothetical protein